MAEVISETLGRTVSYHQTSLADCRAAMLRRGASEAAAQDFAGVVEAQNDGIYDVEPGDPGTATATGFRHRHGRRHWCRDVLKPAIDA